MGVRPYLHIGHGNASSKWRLSCVFAELSGMAGLCYMRILQGVTGHHD